MGGVGGEKWGGNNVYIVLMYEAVKKLMLKKKKDYLSWFHSQDQQILSCSNARFLSKNGTRITPLSKGSQSPSAVYSHF